MNKRIANIILTIFKLSYYIIPIVFLYLIIDSWFIFRLTTLKMCAVYMVALIIFSYIYRCFDIKSFSLSKLTSAQLIVLVFSYIIIQFTLWVNDRNYLGIANSLIFLFATFISYLFLTSLLIKFKVKFIGSKNTVVIVNPDNKASLIKQLARVDSIYNVINVYDENTSFEKIIDSLENIEIILLDEINPQLKSKLINYAFINKKTTIIIPTIEEILIKNSYDLNEIDSPFLVLSNFGPRLYQRIIKRLIDLIGGIIIFIVASPIMLVVAVAIKVYDHGPVLYSQTRLTLDGKEFKVYKFRSMIVNAEKNGAQLAKEHDSRITPVGAVIRKYRLDELPQIFNILKGDMSFVGPRPERPEIASKYINEIPQFNYRLNVKAGLTGYAQVYGRYNTTPKDKLKLDLFYISKFSLLLDLELLFKTFQILFEKESTEGFE